MPVVGQKVYSKMLAKMNIQDDCLTSSIKVFQEKKSLMKVIRFLEVRKQEDFETEIPRPNSSVAVL